MPKYALPLCLFLVLCFVKMQSVNSQDTSACPTLVQAALVTVDELCGNTSRNQACYGNLTLTADPQPNVTDLNFDSPGDIANITDISALHLSGLDSTTQEWGVSLLRLQANLPDTLPGQNVTMLLFGNVDITPVAATPKIEVNVGSGGNINVRGGPSTSDAIVGTLAAGSTVIADGRNADNSWLRVALEDGGVGWVSSQLVSGDEDFTNLNVVAGGEPIYGPVQAFYLSTGFGDAPCAEAPDSGVLIQTPEGAGKIEFTVNAVTIRLGSTAYLQAQPGNTLRIIILEGEAQVEAFDVTQAVPAGAQVEVPLDDASAASGPPSAPAPYLQRQVEPLPVILLPETIALAEPLSDEDIAAFIKKANVCILVSAEKVNLRSGPGTNYLIIDSIKIVRGQSRLKAIGNDDMEWYDIGANLWVRSDLVETTGDCASVPFLTVLPATPVPFTQTVSDSCGSGGVVIVLAGTEIQINDMVPDPNAPSGAIISTFRANGQTIYEAPGDAGGGGLSWGFTWVVPQGTYSIDVVHNPTMQVQPTWSQTPIEAGAAWSHGMCEIRGE